MDGLVYVPLRTPTKLANSWPVNQAHKAPDIVLLKPEHAALEMRVIRDLVQRHNVHPSARCPPAIETQLEPLASKHRNNGYNRRNGSNGIF